MRSAQTLDVSLDSSWLSTITRQKFTDRLYKAPNDKTVKLTSPATSQLRLLYTRTFCWLDRPAHRRRHLRQPYTGMCVSYFDILPQNDFVASRLDYDTPWNVLFIILPQINCFKSCWESFRHKAKIGMKNSIRLFVINFSLQHHMIRAYKSVSFNF